MCRVLIVASQRQGGPSTAHPSPWVCMKGGLGRPQPVLLPLFTKRLGKGWTTPLSTLQYNGKQGSGKILETCTHTCHSLDLGGSTSYYVGEWRRRKGEWGGEPVHNGNRFLNGYKKEEEMYEKVYGLKDVKLLKQKAEAMSWSGWRQSNWYFFVGWDAEMFKTHISAESLESQKWRCSPAALPKHVNHLSAVFLSIFNFALRNEMSDEQEIPPNQTTTLSCETQVCKFHWLKTWCLTVFWPNTYCYPKEPEPFTVSVQAGWAGKYFRAVCYLQSALTSWCDHSFHITGSFTASLTANRFACRQISNITFNSFIFFQVMTHKHTNDLQGREATIQYFITLKLIERFNYLQTFRSKCKTSIQKVVLLSKLNNRHTGVLGWLLAKVTD